MIWCLIGIIASAAEFGGGPESEFEAEYEDVAEKVWGIVGEAEWSYGDCGGLPPRLWVSEVPMIMFCSAGGENYISLCLPPEFFGLSEQEKVQFLVALVNHHAPRRVQSLSAPIAIVSGPGSVSTACAVPVVYSAVQSYGGPLVYNWLLSFNVTNTLQNVTSTSSEVDPLVPNFLGASGLNVHLEVNSVVSEFEVQVNSVPQLVISAVLGRNMYTRPDQYLSVVAEVVDFCNLTAEVTWIWKLNSNPVSNPSPVLSELIVMPYAFAVGAEYQISVEGTNLLQATTEFVNITVVPSNILAVLSRAGGIVSSSYDFTVSANGSYDPDNPSAPVLYSWICKNSSNIIILESTSVELTVPALYLENAVLTITANVSTSAKFTLASLVITGSSSTKTIILVTNYSQNSANIYANCVVSAVIGATAQWSQSSGPPLALSPSNTSILRVAPQLLSPGSTYVFQLSVTGATSEDLATAEFTFTTPSAPVCTVAVTSSKYSGTFLTDFFTIRLTGCSAAEVVGNPLMYSLNVQIGSTSVPLTTLGYSQVFGSYLYPAQNQYLVSACDRDGLCSNYEVVVIVASQKAYAQDLNAIYMNEGIGAIVSLGRNLGIGKSLIDQMWQDINSLYLNSYFPQRIAEILFAGIASLLLQPYFVKSYASAALDILVEILPAIKVSKNLADLCAEIGGGLGNAFKLNSYIVEPGTAFVKNCLQAYSSDFIIGNTYEFTSPNIYVYKETGMVTAFASKNYTIMNRLFMAPSLLPIPQNAVVSLYLIFYPSAGNYSDILDFQYTTNGNYSSLTYTLGPETPIYLSNLDPPFNFTLQTYASVLNGWSCAYLSSGLWYSHGCSITNDNAITSNISFSFNHSSIVSLVDIIYLRDLPPLVYIEDLSLCGKNFSPIWILIGIVFLTVIIVPLLIWLDYKASSKLRFRPVAKANLSGDSEHEGEFSASDSDRSNALNASGDYAIAAPKQAKPKSCLHLLFEGHLTFGLFLAQDYYTRMQRLLTLAVVLCLELFLQGALLYALEDTLQGKSDITQGYFNVYQSKYFGYTIVSVAVGYALEVCLLLLYNLHGGVRGFGVYTAASLVVIVGAGSIVGIVYLALKICANWSGYWSISFIWGALIEVWLLETVAMFVRYCVIR